MEATINGIFPTPIYISKIDRELTKKELSFIDITKSDCNKNEGNITSNDNYILNHKTFKKENRMYFCEIIEEAQIIEDNINQKQEEND